MAGVADEHDRVAVLGELDRLAVHLGHQRAGRVDRPQLARLGVGVDGRAHAVGGEDGDRALGDLVRQLVDEDRPARGEILHDVLVVDDLLAHVDRRAVQLERALDGLDGPVDARAVAARSGQQQLLGGGVHFFLSVRVELVHRLPGEVERALLHLREVVARLVPAVVGPLDEVDRRHAALEERHVVVGDRLADAARERGLRADAAGRGAQLVPQRGVGERLAEDPQVLGADEVEQDQRLELAVVALGVGLRAADAGRLERPRVVGGLLAVEEDEADLAGVLRARRAVAQRTGELHHHGGAGGAVVGADEAGQVLGVVVRGDGDRGLAPADRADDVAQPRVPGDALEAAAGEPVAQALGEAAQRLGARGARAQLDLARQLRPGARGVEAVAAQIAGAGPAGASSAGAGGRRGGRGRGRRGRAGGLVAAAAAGDRRRGERRRQQPPPAGGHRPRTHAPRWLVPRGPCRGGGAGRMPGAARTRRECASIFERPGGDPAPIRCRHPRCGVVATTHLG